MFCRKDFKVSCRQQLETSSLFPGERRNRRSPIKRNVKKKIALGSMPVLFGSRHSAQLSERALLL